MTALLVRRLARLRVPLGFAFAAVALVLARPTPSSLLLGATVALAGEAIRVWAAGHLEKSREVTKSGPYRFTRHPLYVGSSVMGLGLTMAAGSWIVAILVLTYLSVTLTAAIRSEESFLRERFGVEYEAYARGAAIGGHRRFSLARAIRNREYRAVIGLLLAIGVLALKAGWP